MADSKNHCADCGAATDSEGDSLEKNGCGWLHPDDCDTCGHPFCDQSC